MPNGIYTPKIGELIQMLQQLRMDHGDLHCCWYSPGSPKLHGFEPPHFVAKGTIKAWPSSNEEDCIIFESGAESGPYHSKHRICLSEPLEGWKCPHPTTGELVEVVRVREEQA